MPARHSTDAISYYYMPIHSAKRQPEAAIETEIEAAIEAEKSEETSPRQKAKVKRQKGKEE